MGDKLIESTRIRSFVDKDPSAKSKPPSLSAGQIVDLIEKWEKRQ